VTGIFVRGFVYLLLGAAVAELLRLEANTLGIGLRFSEFGYTERLQTLFLFLMVVLLFFRVRRFPDYRQLAMCMAGAFSILLIRENDQILELFLPHGFWKYPAAVLAVALVVYFWRQREVVQEQLLRWARTPSFGVMLSGFVALVFSRLFGRSEFWQTLMGDGYMPAIKTVAEEGVELLAITIIFIAVVELAFFTVRKERG
jgi:hypothetical protein